MRLMKAVMMSRISWALVVSGLLFGCAISLPSAVDLSGNARHSATLMSSCNSACESVIEKTFTYGRRSLHNGISTAILYEVNGTPGAHTFRCADCAGRIVNAFNESWSGKYQVIVPSGETEVVVGINDFRVHTESRHKIRFRAADGRTYAILSIQKDPVNAVGPWIPIVFDTVENRVVFPSTSDHWLRP